MLAKAANLRFRAAAAAAFVAAACAPTLREPGPSESAPMQSASPTPSADAAALPAELDASEPSPEADAAEVEPPVVANDASAPANAHTECPEVVPAPGFSECRAVELTGAMPCEAVCQRPRKAKASRCCENPVEVVVLSGTRALLRLDACGFVPPSCASMHGHGNMDARLRVLDGPPKELVFVEGGCESRALAHGYVPPGVAAWSGCVHRRYRWDGARFTKVAK